MVSVTLCYSLLVAVLDANKGGVIVKMCTKIGYCSYKSPSGKCTLNTKVDYCKKAVSK